MTSERRQSFGPAASNQSPTAPLQGCVDSAIQNLFASFPNPEHLSPEERRGTIARYTAVLEGNFIYWMTAAYLAVASEDARSIIHDNLVDEVRDNHPGMIVRSEEHTSELQSRLHLVCRLLLEKKKKNKIPLEHY